MKRIFAPSLLFAALLPCLSGARGVWTQAAGQQPVTTLRVQSREVVLDVVVTDRKGNFVDGLRRDDFIVQEDKVPQRILSFQSPAMHALAASVPEVRSTTDLQRIGDAPVTILVLDELNTDFADMSYARGALEKWLARQPERLTQPTVLMAASDEKFAVIEDFTQDRDALQAALKKHFPSYPFRMSKGGSVGPDAGQRLAMSLGTLTQIAQASSGTPGRKNVIWVGVGFPQLLLDDVSGTKEEEITRASVRVTDAMLKARVTLSVIDPTAMASTSLDLNNPDFLSLSDLQSLNGPTTSTVSGILNFDTFAPATGGRLYAGRNDVDAEIAQAVANGENYYTMTYAPTNREDGAAKFRAIRVVMRNPEWTATTRTGYFPEAQAAAGTPPPPPETHDLVFDLTSAALSSVVYNGLKVEARKAGEGYALAVKGADLKPHVKSDGSAAAEITVMQVCFANKNKVLSHEAVELFAPLPADGMLPGEVAFTVPKADDPRGTVRVRLVVRDALSGRIGTVDLPAP